jgi:hypothetical protein
MSPSPAHVSDAVFGLMQMISPLLYAGDFRPFFTIHDTEFKDFASPESLASRLVGVTNPFFVKAFGHWPSRVTLHEERRGPGVSRAQSVDAILGNKQGLVTSRKSCRQASHRRPEPRQDHSQAANQHQPQLPPDSCCK